MTDTELLKLAAKSVGFKVSNRLVGGGLMVMSDERPAPHKWNPLTDDGDALRLAIMLNMLVDPNNGHVTTCSATGGFAESEEDMSQCRFAATRLSIVRTAASIGEKIK